MQVRHISKRLRKLAFGLISLTCWTLGFLVLISFTAKIAYSRIVEYRCMKWEATVRRDASGLEEGFEPYTVGDGRIAVLLIHGFGASPAMFNKMAPSLAERGYRCRVMRLPEYGMPPEEFARVSRATWLVAIDREVRTLARESDQVWIVGHSMGASLGVDYLLEYPDQADGIVLLTPLMGVSNARSPLIPPRTLFEVGRHIFRPDDLLESSFSLDLHTNEPVQFEDRDIFTPFSIYTELFRLMDTISSRAEEFKTPMLMVLSPDDKVVDCRAAERYFKAARSSPKDLYYVRDAGHAVPIDNGWDDVVRQIDGFIRDCPQPCRVASTE
ncbi:MAG: alpha/beta fold hydrolase [bacterium]